MLDDANILDDTEEKKNIFQFDKSTNTLCSNYNISKCIKLENQFITYLNFGQPTYLMVSLRFSMRTKIDRGA